MQTVRGKVEAVTKQKGKYSDFYNVKVDSELYSDFKNASVLSNIGIGDEVKIEWEPDKTGRYKRVLSIKNLNPLPPEKVPGPTIGPALYDTMLGSLETARDILKDYENGIQEHLQLVIPVALEIFKERMKRAKN